VHPKLCATTVCCILFALVSLPSRADVILTEGTNFGVDVSPIDGSIVMDLLGSIWLLPANGGQARQLTDGLIPVTAPRWSPGGTDILYEVRGANGSEIWLLDVDSLRTQRISGPGYHDQSAAWHPRGERIVYASERNVSGLDIWETDLPTGLSWRITSHPGDESEPAWSTNGRHLAYIRKADDRYTLVLRRQGEAEQDLVISDTPLSAPSWRPDGSLLTFLRHGEGRPTLEMIILSDPPLARVMTSDENHFSSPVSWRDRSRFYYAADGQIKTRAFADRRSRSLPFRAVVKEDDTPTPRTVPKRELVVTNPPSGRLVIRGARLFDGIWQGYREQMDVLIDQGLIVEIAPRREWVDATVLDLGNVTILPGLIDAWSGAPQDDRDGPAILAYGVTTIVSQADIVTPKDPVWENEAMPGPRVLPAATVSALTDRSDNNGYFLVKMLPNEAGNEADKNAVTAWRELGVPIIAANWINGRRIGADILLGADALPTAAQHSQDPVTPKDRAAAPPVLISALADASTPGISALIESRQASELSQKKRPGRRIAGAPQLATTPALVVAGSEPNGLAPGLALHAELRALRAAGLSAEQVLLSASRNAAQMLGLDNQVGTITPGAMADLILVRGDPLADVDDLLKIVAVVRNGRFFSLISLLERVNTPSNVE
jgi:hypothetical protein